MRSITPRSSGLALVGLLLVQFACTKNLGDGLLSLRISADATYPPPAASKLVLSGTPGGISRTYADPFQIVPGSPVLFQFPALPASDSPITFSIATYAGDDCQVGRNALSITATIKAGAETGPIDVTLVSTGSCLDAGDLDALAGPADVATSNNDGTGGFPGTGGNTKVGSGGSGSGGSGGGATVPTSSGGAAGNASGGMTTTTSGGSGGVSTGGRTGSGSGGNGGIRIGGGGIIGAGGTSISVGGIVGSGGVGTGGTGTGGIVGTGGAGTGGIVGTGGAGTGGIDGEPNCNATMPTSGGKTYTGTNGGGTIDSYNYGIWTNGKGGTITAFPGGAFTTNWSESQDFLAHLGIDYRGGKAVADLGTVVAEFAEKKSGSAGSWSTIGMYGWMNSPCVEWYINEDSWNGMGGGGSTTVTIDGGSYSLSSTTTTGTGGANACESGHSGGWTQIKSSRKSARTCGIVTVSDHFAAWANQGWKLGAVTSIHINVEVGGGTGSIDFPIANITTTSK